MDNKNGEADKTAEPQEDIFSGKKRKRKRTGERRQWITISQLQEEGRRGSSRCQFRRKRGRRSVRMA